MRGSLEDGEEEEGRPFLSQRQGVAPAASGLISLHSPAEAARAAGNAALLAETSWKLKAEEQLRLGECKQQGLKMRELSGPGALTTLTTPRPHPASTAVKSKGDRTGSL